MTHERSVRSRLRETKPLVFALFLAGGCDPSPSTGGTGGAAGMAGASGTGGAFDGHTITRPGTNEFVIQLPADGGDAGASGSDAGGSTGGTSAGGSAGSAGSAGSPVAQCIPASPSGTPPTVALCGDGFRTAGEACDDGNTSSGDGCSALCQITPELVSPRAAPASGAAPLASRTIGAGRHPLVAGCNTVAVAFADHGTEPPSLLLSTFSSAGVPQATSPVANVKVSEPNPGVAALPGDALAVAWTDFDDDELGILLRKIVPGAPAQSAAIVANEDSAFSQSEPDIIFDGSELVVAWVDSHDPATSPDIRYRLFAPDLTPLTGDQTLAATAAVEDNVVLAGRSGHSAAAWRAGSQGLESIEVQSGAAHWTIGPFQPGAAEDRPDLIFLDETHLAVAFTMGTDPDNTGVANVPRLHGAVLDPSTPGLTESFALAPAHSPYAETPSIGQSEPSLVMAADHLLVGWRSDARPGDGRGSELWSRRVPFNVNGNTVTLDPSHIEVPVVQTDAQRDGDQNAFRVVGTTLSPSGGIASVWEDASHSFGKISGGPDVALQFLPDFAEPPGASPSYRVSADGKYYYVNLLTRNYPPPSANATYTGSAAQLTFFQPSWATNGDDSPFLSHAPANDPSSTATLTIDMGQYFSVGGVRLFYYYGGNTPATQRIRLATTPGQWTTVVDTSPPASDDVTVSFDATPARFLEVTMTGNGAIGEAFVYPSAQSGPPPSPMSGYDLGYLASTSVNSNAVTSDPWVWPAGTLFAHTDRQGGPPLATGDAVGIVDLGAQYPVSRLSLGFYVNSNWANGGRIEVAAVPGAYSTVYDSGPGNLFGTQQALTEEFAFSQQPVRYIRTTDYFIPGVGASGGILESVQAFVTPAPVTAYYPLSADRKYFTVNLARRPTGGIQPSASAVFANGAVPYTPTPQVQIAANAIDGDDNSFVLWTGWWTAVTDATATLTVDLGQVESIGAVRQLYGAYMPLSSSISVGETLGGPWTQVLVDTPVTASDSTSSFDKASARYVELTMKGTPALGFVNLLELQVFPSSATDPAPSSGGHLDLSYLTGMAPVANANMGQNGSPRVHSVAGATGYYIKTAAQGATGDATLTLDLGQQYQVSEVTLSWYSNQTWPAGGKIDVDDGSGNWVTVFDSGHGTPLGPAADGTQRISFAPHQTRYVRLTGYFDPNAAQGLLENIEVF